VKDAALADRLRTLDRPFGDERRRLRCGPLTLDIEGLDADLARLLGERWGAFLEPAPAPRRPGVRLLRAGPEGWLPPAEPGSYYRIEARSAAPVLAVSYHFALGPDAEPGLWRAGISERASEPLGRVVENALRYLTARVAVERGGFALHAAGVVRDGRAFVLAGPSGAGKSTAVRLAAPARSLGDDFAVLLPDGDGWCTPAVPFDNSERATHAPAALPFPVEGVFRLHQAPAARVERPTAALAAASLMACTAFPWALPDQGHALAEHVGRFVASGRYHHLYFTREDSLWSQIEGARG
jgi:hypothetical protein